MPRFANAVIGALTVGILGTATGYAVTVDDRAEDRAAIGTIQDSYAFDVTNRTELMKRSGEVFVGRVTKRVKTLAEESSTVWDVQVLEAVKGPRSSGTVQVRQLGWVESNGRTHQTEDQPLLKPGAKYLMVTNRQGSGNVLVGGPEAAKPADSTAEQRDLVRDYRAAAAK